MITLVIYWRDTRREQSIKVAGVNLDPSGSFWYYLEDPNDQVQVARDEYYWAKVDA